MIHRRFMIHDDPWPSHWLGRDSAIALRWKSAGKAQDLRCCKTPWHNIHQRVAPVPSFCKVEEYTIWCSLFWKRATHGKETSHICALGPRQIAPTNCGTSFEWPIFDSFESFDKKAFDVVGDLCRSDDISLVGPWEWTYESFHLVCKSTPRRFLGKHQLHLDPDLISQRRIPWQCYLTPRQSFRIWPKLCGTHIPLLLGCFIPDISRFTTQVAYWDEYMRRPDVRKNRHCIRHPNGQYDDSCQESWLFLTCSSHLQAPCNWCKSTWKAGNKQIFHFRRRRCFWRPGWPKSGTLCFIACWNDGYCDSDRWQSLSWI